MACMLTILPVASTLVQLNANVWLQLRRSRMLRVLRMLLLNAPQHRLLCVGGSWSVIPWGISSNWSGVGRIISLGGLTIEKQLQLRAEKDLSSLSYSLFAIADPVQSTSLLPFCVLFSSGKVALNLKAFFSPSIVISVFFNDFASLFKDPRVFLPTKRPLPIPFDNTPAATGRG